MCLSYLLVSQWNLRFGLTNVKSPSDVGQSKSLQLIGLQWSRYGERSVPKDGFGQGSINLCLTGTRCILYHGLLMEFGQLNHSVPWNESAHCRSDLTGKFLHQFLLPGMGIC